MMPRTGSRIVSRRIPATTGPSTARTRDERWERAVPWLRPPSHEPPSVRRYGVALIASTASAVIDAALTPVWGIHFPFLVFYPATMVAAWYGGFAPGALSTGLSLAAILHGQHAFHVRDPGAALGLGVFVVINLLIAVFCESLHQAVRVHVASAQRLDALLWHAPVGLCFLDRDLRFVYVNDALTAMNGLSREAHIGRTVGEVLPPGSAGATSSLMREALRTGQPAVNRVVPDTGRSSDPSEPVFLVSYSPVRGSDGDVELVAVAIMDVTEQQRLSDALARSEARLQSIAQASIQITSTVSIDQPLDDTLRLIADRVREVVGARQVAISLRDRVAGRQDPAAGKLEVPIIGRDRKALGLLSLR